MDKKQFVEEEKQVTEQKSENAALKKHEQGKKRGTAYTSATYIAKIAMLAAAAMGLLYIEFPIFPATAWLKLNVSDFPALIASFMFGPISGVIVNGVKVGLCLLLRGTSTGFVGDLSNLVSGIVYALAAGVIYKIKKDKIGAIISLVASGALFVLSMWAFNLFVLLPFYNIPQSTYPEVMAWTVLFNVIKVGVTGLVTFIVYKSVHKLFDRF